MIILQFNYNVLRNDLGRLNQVEEIVMIRSHWIDHRYIVNVIEKLKRI